MVNALLHSVISFRFKMFGLVQQCRVHYTRQFTAMRVAPHATTPCRFQQCHFHFIWWKRTMRAVFRCLHKSSRKVVRKLIWSCMEVVWESCKSCFIVAWKLLIARELKQAQPQYFFFQCKVDQFPDHNTGPRTAVFDVKERKVRLSQTLAIPAFAAVVKGWCDCKRPTGSVGVSGSNPLCSTSTERCDFKAFRSFFLLKA